MLDNGFHLITQMTTGAGVDGDVNHFDGTP
jgi:hypothetical protein